LLAGLFALGAGILAWRAVERQIAQQYAIIDSNNRAKLLAAKADLVIALQDIYSYVDTTDVILIGTLRSSPLTTPELIFSTRGRIPRLPKEALRIVAASLEYSDGFFQRGLASLIEHVQVQNSRMNSYIRPPPEDGSGRGQTMQRQNIYQCIADILVVLKWTDRLLSHARDGDDFDGDPIKIEDFSRLIQDRIPAGDRDRVVELLGIKLRVEADRRRNT
jgi:hypothetical protein